MPKAGEICGILFFIFREIGAPHHLPHVLVKYGEYKGNFAIETGEQLNGRLFPARQSKTIQKVLVLHKEELLKFWHNLQQDTPESTAPIF